MDLRSVEAEQGGVLGAAQAHRPLEEHLKYGLDVGGRPRNHLEDLGRRRLLFRTLGQGASQPVVLGLNVRVRPTRGHDRANRHPAVQTESGVGGVLLLAPGTVHAASTKWLGTGLSTVARRRGLRQWPSFVQGVW